jgi:hypothetical protein
METKTLHFIFGFAFKNCWKFELFDFTNWDIFEIFNFQRLINS